MQAIKVICSNLFSALNTSLTVAFVNEEREQSSGIGGVRNETLSESDPHGAVKFTIAVVFLYGIGVIGLLGITARRNRQVQLMDKEVNKFLKMQHQSDSFTRNTKHRKRKMKTVNKLIASLHFQDRVNEADAYTPLSLEHFENSSSWNSKSNNSKPISSQCDGIDKTAASIILINETECRIASWDKSVHFCEPRDLSTTTSGGDDTQQKLQAQVSLNLKRIEEENGHATCW